MGIQLILQMKPTQLIQATTIQEPTPLGNTMGSLCVCIYIYIDIYVFGIYIHTYVDCLRRFEGLGA